MFLPDGKLREEYRFLDEKSTAEPAVEAPAAAQVPAAETREPEPAPQWEPPRGAGPAGGETSPLPADLGGPSFFDLGAMLAEPVPLYLGGAPLPDGQRAGNPEMRRVPMPLLECLRRKAAG